MSRQRLPIGTHGEITVMNLPDGRVEVRTRYRDFDGKARLVSARAATKSSALAELKKRLAQRTSTNPSTRRSRSTACSASSSTTGSPTSTWRAGSLRRPGGATWTRCASLCFLPSST